MTFQVTDYKTNEIKGFNNVIALRSHIFNLTKDLNVANEVAEWANTPTLGSYRYDAETFCVALYNYSED